MRPGAATLPRKWLHIEGGGVERCQVGGSLIECSLMVSKGVLLPMGCCEVHAGRGLELSGEGSRVDELGLRPELPKRLWGHIW